MTGPRVEPENQNQNPENQNQNQNLENPQQQQQLETPIQNTQPQSTDTVPRSEVDTQMAATHNLYRMALQEAEGKRLELERQLAARNTQHSPAPIPDEELTPAQLIDRSIQNSMAPLVQGFNQFQVSQQQLNYQNIKNQFRNLPQFAPFFSQLEPFLDQEMQGKAITVETVQNALATVIGRIQMQAALNPQNQNQNLNTNPVNNNNPQNPQQNQNPQNNLRPPHLQPSAPPLPNRNGSQNLTPGGNVRYQLTALQQRLARENKLTEDQYIDWITETPESVIHSNIGKPPRTT